MSQQTTKVWDLYQKGKDYNHSLKKDYYNVVTTNIDFFEGEQWRGLSQSNAMNALPKPVFNIIKRIGSVFVASLTSSATKVSYEPLANKSEMDLGSEQDPIVEDIQNTTAAQMATSEVANLFDKFGMDYKIRDALFDGVKTGDYCAHFYWDPEAKPYGGTYDAYRGEIKMELVDGVNVMFGNPNTPIVEDQPYILIAGRDMVENLREEYKAHNGDNDMEAGAILSDKDYNEQAGYNGKIELGDDDKTGKALFIYCYTKRRKEVKLVNPDGTPQMVPVLDENGQPKAKKMKNGMPMLDVEGNPVYEEKQATEMRETVWVSKHTKFIDIFEPVDTGLQYYPVAWGNWEKQKNCYHGKALVTDIIPNQIYINSLFALVCRHQQMLGFPKIIYDGNIMGQWNNAVGQAIPVYDLPPDKRLSDLYGIIQPADMSTQIVRCIEEAMAMTKECLGATDAQLGNVRPDNTSALIATQSASQVPLENPQASKYQWVEDIGRILLDMMGTYYGRRPVVRRGNVSSNVVDPVTGQPSIAQKQQKVIEMYDFSQLKNLWLNVRADVGASTYWSRIAIVQTLDNLKQSGALNLIEYLERMPDEYIPMKAELLESKRAEMTQQQQPTPPEEGNGGPQLGTLPTAMQDAYNNLSTRAQNTLLKQSKANMVK